MGKKKNASVGLGKGLIKDRSKQTKKVAESWLHTSELHDGYDWNRINLRSVTEQSNLDEFLETAALAGTEFTAERLNVKVIDPGQHTGLPSAEENDAISKAQLENIEFLQIPRRPKWDSSTTPEQLNQMEKEAFLAWRRNLSLLQEKDHIMLTPFERNLDFWRQLWRVIERSDIIVQIVDARNPLLFRCQDLEKYVKEVSSSKENMILISKADMLTQAQRDQWARYFSQQGMRVAFWSAVVEEERLAEKEAELQRLLDAREEELEEDDDDDDDDDDEEEEEEVEEEEDMEEDEIQDDASPIATDDIHSESLSGNVEGLAISANSTETPSTASQSDMSASHSCDSNNDRTTAQSQTASKNSTQDTPTVPHTNEQDVANPRTDIPPAAMEQGASGDTTTSLSCCHDNSDARTANMVSDSEGGVEMTGDERGSDDAQSDSISNTSHLLTGEELLEFFKEIHAGRSKVNADVTTVGLVGYPNVGKSSTLNALLKEKKVAVSATPGRTKHFQTIFVEPTLCLCDCPGLVMPSFVSTKADMYLNGILPIDQMRDFAPPTSLLCQRMPRQVLELSYGMNLITPGEGEDPNRPPTTLELLNAHAYVRGFMTHKGVPDCFRSARIVLKDYVNGKLLYRMPPPGMTPEEFESVQIPSDEVGEVTLGLRPKKFSNKPMINEGGQTVKKSASKKVDDNFFAKPGRAHTKAMAPGASHKVPGSEELPPGVRLMGKPWKKQKRGKKEKLRRVYGHLDEK